MFSKPILCYMISRLLLTGVSLAAGQQEVQHSDPSPPPRRDMYEAAEDMWVKVLSLNTLAPEFLGQNNTEVEAQVGGEASFSCYTYHLSDEMQAWELWVKEVQLTDAGQYECQLTTNPPVSFFFSLVVTQAEAVVAGPSEVHIEEGSHLALDCYVQNAPLPPVYIFWYHNNTMVNYGRLEALQVEHHNYTSSLVVSHVRPSHAGTYTCDPHLATPANVTVHVVTEYGGVSVRELMCVRKIINTSSPGATHGRNVECAHTL
ncbi:Hemicentin-1-like 11, partial [Homarus americanus]